MELKIIAAVSADGVIGIGSKIPWSVPEDFKHFRNTTMGNVLIVGYNTYLSLPDKAFEGRKYILINKKDSIAIPENRDVVQVKSEDMAVEYLKDYDISTAFVIGGGVIYERMINMCDEVIITWVNKCYDFPEAEDLVYFPIEVLFSNFFEFTETEWKTSKTNTKYKIVEYLKSK